MVTINAVLLSVVGNHQINGIQLSFGKQQEKMGRGYVNRWIISNSRSSNGSNVARNYRNHWTKCCHGKPAKSVIYLSQES
jgi:hypothetical protein